MTRSGRVSSYVGRFAPSPTGPLHLGSLLTAVASFLHARQNAGRWLLRIENIDPPREQPGAITSILATLEAMALEWDGEIGWQNRQLERFRRAADQLERDGLAYRCTCSRKEIRAASGSNRYPGTCRNLGLVDLNAAVRLVTPTAKTEIVDELQGHRLVDIMSTEGDFIIFRRDGLPAYHLAVVIDDAASGVTDIVRGIDLIDQTAAHIRLQSALGLDRPRYWHVPVVVDENGHKLSKQTGARGITPDDDLSAIARLILGMLELHPPVELAGAPLNELWQWGAETWDIGILAGQEKITRPPTADDSDFVPDRSRE